MKVNLDEIKEALEKVESVEWNVTFDDFIGMPVMNIIGEECTTVASKAPEWLASLVEQVKEMQKTLSFYAEPQNWELPYFGRGHSVVTTDRGNLARQALQSLKGEPK
jgi:DNA-binding transcriptional MerR regulator